MPAALAAAAHRRWGSTLPTRLRGAFALLVWDSQRREGLIAVDQLGAGSVVYRRSSGRLAFATEIRDLLPLLGATPRPDERLLVRWLVDGTREPEETLLAGIRRLPGGHMFRLGSDTHKVEPYWLRRHVPTHPIDGSEAASVLRAGLVRATERGCARGGPHGVLLSGGLDSSAVAAVAARSGCASLVAYSAVFPNHPETDESTLVAERAEVLGLSTGRVSFRRGGSLAASLRYLDSWKLPPASPNLFFHEPLLQLAKREGMTTMLDGQGGDELFGLSPYLAADRLRSGRLLEMRRLLRLLLDPDDAAVPAARRHVLREVALKGVLPAWLHELARRRTHRYAPSWLTDEAVDLYAGGRSPWVWKESAGPRWWAYLADAVTKGRERAGAHDFFRHAFADAGLAGSHPLLEDVDLVETVLALPPELAFDARFDRPLLREALVGLVPDPIRLRAEKSFFNDVLADAVHVEDAAAIERLLGADAVIRRYVHGDLFERLRGVPPSRRGRRETWLLWRLAVAECWLRMQEAPQFAREALADWGLAEPDFTVLGSRPV